MSCLPATSAIRLPTALEPVKWIIWVPAWLTSRSPISWSPVTTLNTPAGRPASASSSAISRPPDSGVSGDGLSTTALPSASAGAVTRMPRMSGKFHGVITPTTPTGTRSAMLRRLVLWEGRISPTAREVSAAASYSSLAAPPTSYCALPGIEPVSRTIRSATSSARACSAAAARRSTAARSS